MVGKTRVLQHSTLGVPMKSIDCCHQDKFSGVVAGELAEVYLSGAPPSLKHKVVPHGNYHHQVFWRRCRGIRGRTSRLHLHQATSTLPLHVNSISFPAPSPSSSSTCATTQAWGGCTTVSFFTPFSFLKHFILSCF